MLLKRVSSTKTITAEPQRRRLQIGSGAYGARRPSWRLAKRPRHGGMRDELGVGDEVQKQPQDTNSHCMTAIYDAMLPPIYDLFIMHYTIQSTQCFEVLLRPNQAQINSKHQPPTHPSSNSLILTTLRLNTSLCLPPKHLIPHRSRTLNIYIQISLIGPSISA